uniref:Uncharacterized protein n=1 Tax=Arundo donax TaxID=35708 RepID=A0A0A9F7Q7_ARUDO
MLSLPWMLPHHQEYLQQEPQCGLIDHFCSGIFEQQTPS